MYRSTPMLYNYVNKDTSSQLWDIELDKHECYIL